MIDINVTFNSESNVLYLSINSDNPIKSVYIDTQRTFNCGENESKSAWKYTLEEEDESNPFEKTIKLNDIIDPTNALFNANVDNDIFFIYVYTHDGSYTYRPYTKIVYNESYLYNKVLNMIHGSIVNNKCCTIDNSIADILIALKGLEMSSLGKEKVYYWNILHNVNSVIDNKCLCNG